MTDNVLIDTDVILDFFFDREPFAEFATEVLDLCEKDELQGSTTPVIICNVYYLLRKTAAHNVVVEKLRQLLTIMDVLNMDKDVVLDSLNSDFTDFEDALQNFSAIKNGKVNMVLTRNIRDYRKSALTVLTPETYLKEKASR